jgi:biofilm PGA synthesis N-glycosyltransferase PgaC
VPDRIATPVLWPRFTEAPTVPLPRLRTEPEPAGPPWDWFRPAAPEKAYRKKAYRKVVAIVPAWNEADAIAGTVRALQRQSRPLDGIVVVANNCDDDTAALARQAGAQVLDMPVNPHKKAGAMNYALDLVLPGLDDEDFVLLQDADTSLNPDFTRYAVEAMRPDVGGVCARYDNPAPRNFIERLQASEFTRSRRKISRARGKVLILVGIATLFRVGVLRHVLAAREAGELPGSRTYYNLASLCEDYEMTLAMRTLGYRLTSPAQCRPRTHAMPTLAKLRGQRVRWTRGALDDLQDYGMTPITRIYITAQIGRLLSMLSPVLFAAYLISLQLTYGRIAWDLPWVAVNGLFIGERVITVRKAGWRAMLLSALLLPELLYDWFMAACYMQGLVLHLRGTAPVWKET